MAGTIRQADVQGAIEKEKD